MRILVAEDETTIARALKVMLEKNKYTVDVVYNGDDALVYLRTTRYDALVRRSESYTPAALHLGNVELDTSCYLLRTKAGEGRLNNKEYQLMELFLRNPRQVFSSEHLMERIWGMNSEAEMDVVWTYIGFLRKKLRQIGANVEIQTIRGAGCALEEITC